MNRWKLAICGAAIACVACGNAVIDESPHLLSSIPGVMAGTSDRAPASTGVGRFTTTDGIVTKVGTSRITTAPNSLVEKDSPNSQSSINQPLPAANPCNRAGKPTPMCPTSQP
jgi:hypothetical protein